MRPKTSAAVLAALLLAGHCHACSDMLMYDPEASPAVVSVRSLDFPPTEGPRAEITYDFAAVPRGAAMTHLPVGTESGGCGASGFDGTPAKHGFTCIAFWREAVLPEDCGPAYNNTVGLCLDGLNEAGLAVASLGFFQPSDREWGFPDAVNTSSGLPALDTLSVASFVLSQYGTVAEVAAGLAPGKLQIVDPAGRAGGGGIQIPLHWAVSDAKGNYAVIELSGPGTWQVIPAPDGVATNYPVAQSKAAADDWQAKQVAQFGEQDGALTTPGFCQVTDPGSRLSASMTTIAVNVCDPLTRYTILRMLKDAMWRRGAFPQDDPYSPSSSPDPAHAAIVQAMLILSRVTIPGSWPNNTRVLPTDMSEVQFVRDHVNATYYFKAVSTPQWLKLDVRRLAAAAPAGGARFTPLEDLAPATLPWFVDKTAQVEEGGA